MPAGVFAQKAEFLGAQTVFSNLESEVVAVDKAGNVFIADGASIVKTPAGGGTPVTVASNLGGAPISLAVDGADNLYAAIAVTGIEFDFQVLKIPAGGGSPVSLGVGLAVAADLAGDVFIAGAGNGVAEIPANGGPEFFIPASSGMNPAGVAVDAKENLFVTDDTTNDVYEIPFTSSSKVTVGTGFSSPLGVAVDNAGNVFVADNGNNQVVEISAGGGSQAVGTSLNAPRNVAVNAQGVVYIADTGNKRVVEEQLRFVNFGSANVCPSNATNPSPCSQTLTLELALYPGVVGQPATFTPRILTQGAQNQDFSQSGESCGFFNPVVHFCTLTVKFGPSFPGLRQGALQVIESPGGSVALSVPLYGIGTGPQVAFNSSTQAKIPASELNSPVAVATDGAGDVFIVDTDNNRLVEVPAGGGAQTTVDAELANPLGVAVDGAGDVFIADHGNNRVVKIPSGGGAWTTVGTGLAGPAGVAVDGAGDVFIADYTNNQVVEVPSGGAPQVTVATAADGLSGPRGMALDSSGNLYIASSESALVLKVLAGGAGKAPVGTGLNAPYGVAVDAAGDVYIADYGLNSVIEVPADGPQTMLGSGLSIPTGVAVDGAGNVVVADYGNARVLELPRSQPPALSFAATDIGKTSTDSPQTVIAQNIGNDPLILSGLSYPADFPVDSAAGGSEDLCTSTSSLSAGQLCYLPVNFTPLHAGALSESLTLTDDALNATAATQSIALSGTGIAVNTPAAITSPTAGSTLTGPSVSFTWTPTGATLYYLSIGSTGVGSNNVYNSGWRNSTSWTATGLPTNGEKLYVRLSTDYNGTVVHNDYTYAASTQAAITSPTAGSTLTGPSMTFNWSAATGAVQYYLSVGSTGVGSSNVYNSGWRDVTSWTAIGMPTNGETLYVRLTTDYNGLVEHSDTTYTAATQAVLTTPTPNSTLTGSIVTFNWTAGTTGATLYYISIGSTGAGSSNIFNSGWKDVTSWTATGLPANGEKLYVRLSTDFNGTAVHTDYTYTAH